MASLKLQDFTSEPRPGHPLGRERTYPRKPSVSIGSRCYDGGRSGMEGLILIAVLLVCLCIVLPIVAFVRTNRIRTLELRLAGVEAALLRLMRQQEAVAAPAVQAAPVTEAPAVTAPAAAAGLPPPVRETVATAALEPSAPAPPASESLEAVIGQKWVGWIAVLLIFCAAAFFLKYAFENRWIGERSEEHTSELQS